MRFSFIIPALNEEDYVEPCVRSIQGQTCKDYEIIVVDNGSTDRTAEIARQLGCKVVNEQKRGISHARNKGAKIAIGDILCFVDADGVVSNNWLKEAKKTLSNQEIKFAVGINIFSHRDRNKAYPKGYKKKKH